MQRPFCPHKKKKKLFQVALASISNTIILPNVEKFYTQLMSKTAKYDESCSLPSG